MAFRGTFDYSLDAKNRLTVPAKFRPTLAGGVVLSRSLDVPCVELWRPDAYDRFTTESLKDLNPMAPEVRRLRRFFASSSFETELDGAGRVAVPPPLAQHASLDKEVTVVGAEDHLEIWSRDAWLAHDAELAAEVPDLAARLGHPA
ncbi:MAG TPA: division/cell wall cluster transcriptional repressor MraZ [Solirubrobacteraceae bacterium]|nr:division/cell wall cluster transcriptional repressor MraZ [Solirubrobacteraceae bacterium]